MRSHSLSLFKSRTALILLTFNFLAKPRVDIWLLDLRISIMFFNLIFTVSSGTPQCLFSTLYKPILLQIRHLAHDIEKSWLDILLVLCAPWKSQYHTFQCLWLNKCFGNKFVSQFRSIIVLTPIINSYSAVQLTGL